MLYFKLKKDNNNNNNNNNSNYNYNSYKGRNSYSVDNYNAKLSNNN